jgi:parallel beta-helix repeat protein
MRRGVSGVLRRWRALLVVALALTLGLAALGADGARRVQKVTARCMGLNPTIPGTDRGETLRGTPRRDVFQAGGGNDRILGRGGNDVICAGSGADVVSGGGGADRVLGSFGNDRIAGDGGNDRLSGQTGSDTVDGGDGNDTATGGSGGDAVAGGAGADLLGGGRGSDVVDGGDGDDRAYGGLGHDTLRPGAGTDTLYGGQGADDVMPGDGPSTIVPDPADEVSDPGDPALAAGEDVVVPDPSAEALLGGDADPSDLEPIEAWRDHVDPGGGDDVVRGSPAADTVVGSSGNDTISGGEGDDVLDGGDDDDSVSGGEGGDRIDGGAGNDPALSGGEGQDAVNAGPGDDTVQGGPERDVIDGGPGVDVLEGGDGGDEIEGGPDDATDAGDTITGGTSFDSLHGGGGNDTIGGGDDADALFGDAGDDNLNSGAGFDDAYGGLGADVCTEGEQQFCESGPAGDDTTLVRDAPTGGAGCTAWVANSGDDAAEGTATQPFRTVERLANSLRPGETGCLVGGQTFEEPDSEIHVRGGGDPGNPVTIKTGPGAGSGPEPRATVKGRLWIDKGAHDIVFENLALNGANSLAALRGDDGALPSPTVNGNRVSFLGNDITTDRKSTCLAIGAFNTDFGVADGTVIKGNRVHACGVPTPPEQNSGDNGIDLEGSHNAVIADNYVFDNSDRGVLVFGDVQGSQVTDNAITGNRIDVHFGTAVFNGADVLPEHNHFTNNVIARATLARDSGGEWEVEGNKARPASPDPQDNLVDFNCIWNQRPNGAIQQPNIAFTDGGHNTVQPAGGPGFVNADAGDFRLTDAPGTCSRSFGPEDPPVVGTEDASSDGTVGYTITDRSRTAGSTVWIEYRRDSDSGRGTDGQATAPVSVAPGATASGRVPLPGRDPRASYRFRAVARSISGFVYGPEKTIVPPSTGPPPPRPLPKPGANAVNLTAAKATGVKARLRGVERFQPIPLPVQVTFGSAVDASRGSVRVAMGGSRGITSLGASGGIFFVRQGAGSVPNLDLGKRLRCGTRKRSRGGDDTNRVSIRYERRGNRKVTVSGRLGYAVPTGDAKFALVDLCEGTRVSVQQGEVIVRDPTGHLVKRLRDGDRVLLGANGRVFLRRGNR